MTEKKYLFATRLAVIVLIPIAIIENDPGWWCALAGWTFGCIAQYQVAARE